MILAKEYDIVIVGGGLAGSTLARVLAEHDIKVLVIEHEKRFRDRVRGELLVPWGIPDARDLEVYEYLVHSCGHELLWVFQYENGVVNEHRDLLATTSHQSGYLAFYHPDMQEVLLSAAATAGAEISRGVQVKNVVPGEPVTIVLANDMHIRSRLVVGADGRNSNMRTWGRFKVTGDPKQTVFASVLLEHMNLPEDALHIVGNPTIGQTVVVVPLGRQRFRCCVMYVRRNHYRQLSGPQRIPDFISACMETGAPSDWYRASQVAGPLATFEGAATWVDRPFQNNVVLIGDAAATSDPTWACGMALTLRDVRILRDQLRLRDEWAQAAEAYAREHDRIYAVMHRIERWHTELFFTIGPEADARRSHVFQRCQEEPNRMIDMHGIGPDAPNDRITRSEFFAED
jgi:2-polyprenyl-6-methoxyphenol hydroxylase-like FAD-dependent oxidoreductase